MSASRNNISLVKLAITFMGLVSVFGCSSPVLVNTDVVTLTPGIASPLPLETLPVLALHPEATHTLTPLAESTATTSLVLPTSTTVIIPSALTMQIERISVGNSDQEANYTSEAPALSGDGHVIAFVSSASNLVSDDSSTDCTSIFGEAISCADIFVRDLATGETERISVTKEGAPGFGNSGVIDEWGSHVAISADGHSLAFHSSAVNLIPDCLGGGIGILIVERLTEQAIECASRGIDGAPPNGRSIYPALSADGRYVAFISEASNLVEGDTNSVADIFVLDRQTQNLERVSVTGSNEQANAASDMFFGGPAISGDGRFVVFVSYANLTPDDGNHQPDIFLRDRLKSETTLLSHSLTGEVLNGEVFAPAISADGRFVAFHSDADNLVIDDTNGSSDVFVLELATGTLERVSVSSDGSEGNERSTGALLSGDGQWVAFSSLADNLVPGDTNETVDAFLHDRQSGMTYRVSVGANGLQGNGPSTASDIAENGCCVAIWSMADNLVDGDNNGVWDIFLITMQ